MSSSLPAGNGMAACAPGAAPAPQPLAAVFFTDHHPWLLGRLRHRLGSRADAEDLASETFVRVVAQPDLSAVDTPRAFLTTIAKRVLFDFWRRRDLERAYLDAIAHLPEALAPSPEERALLLESLQAIAQALDGLPDKVQRAFLMSQLDAMTYAEIGAQLGVSASMVRKYMVQGWQACARALDGPG